MTLLQALDVWARVTKQRMPMSGELKTLARRPTIDGGGFDLVGLGTVSYSSGDYATWPMRLDVRIGANPRKVEAVEHAKDVHFAEPADKLARVPDGAKRQEKAAYPKLDGHCRVGENALIVHAAVDQALRDLQCPGAVVLAILRRHPRDRHDPLNSGGTDADGRLVWNWLKESGMEAATGFRSSGRPAGRNV